MFAYTVISTVQSMNQNWPFTYKGVAEAFGDSGTQKKFLECQLRAEFHLVPAKFRDVSILEGQNESSFRLFRPIAESFKNDY